MGRLSAVCVGGGSLLGVCSVKVRRHVKDSTLLATEVCTAN